MHADMYLSDIKIMPNLAQIDTWHYLFCTSYLFLCSHKPLTKSFQGNGNKELYPDILFF